MNNSVFRKHEKAICRTTEQLKRRGIMLLGTFVICAAGLLHGCAGISVQADLQIGDQYWSNMPETSAYAEFYQGYGYRGTYPAPYIPFVHFNVYRGDDFDMRVNTSLRGGHYSGDRDRGRHRRGYSHRESSPPKHHK